MQLQHLGKPALYLGSTGELVLVEGTVNQHRELALTLVCCEVAKGRGDTLPLSTLTTFCS